MNQGFLDSIFEKYRRKTAFRVLVNRIPYVGSSLDLVINQTWEKMQAERLRNLFDELAKGTTLLSDELVENVEFVHCFMATCRAVLHTHRHEKIELFGRMLKSTFIEVDSIDLDEFDQYLAILDDLNYREILALRLLDTYSGRPRDQMQNDLQWTSSFWDEYVREMSQKLSVEPEELPAFMARMARTGCYEVFTGYLDAFGERGKLTPIYFRLKRLVAELETHGDDL